MCVLRLRTLAGQNKSPRRYGWGLGSRASSPRLRGAWFFGRGGLLDLLFYVRDAGEGADVDLVVISLQALLALGAASAQERAQVAAQEPQRDREQRRVHEREDGVYGDDRGQRRLRIRAGHHVRAEYDQDDAREQADQDARHRPGGVEPPPEDRQQDNGHVGARGDREGERNQERHVEASRRYRQEYRRHRDPHGREARRAELLLLRGVAAPDHVRVEVVGEGAGCSHDETGNHRNYGGESDRRDEGEEDGTAERLGELRSGRVPRRVLRRDGVLADEQRRAVAQNRCQQVEQAYDPGRRDNRGPGRLGVRDGEEPDQDVWQPRRTEHEGDVERDHVESGDEPGRRRRLHHLGAYLRFDLVE